MKRTLCAEELSRDVDGLAADDDNLLAAEQLLGDDAGETSEEVAFAVNDDLRLRSWSAGRPLLREKSGAFRAALLPNAVAQSSLTTGSKEDILAMC